MRHLLLVLPLGLCCFFANAQEQLGLRTHPYAGINAALLNPAAPASSPFSWDVNLLEGAYFMENNYAFLQNTRLGDLLKADAETEFFSVPDLPEDANLPEGSILVDFYSGARKRFAQINSSVMGPSFFFRIGEAHTLGIITRARAMATGNGVSGNLSYFIYDERPFFEPFTVEPFSLGIMAWSELGLNYTYTLPTASGYLSIGATVRYLQGYEGAYLRSHQAFELTKLPDESLSGEPFDFELGYTDGLLEDDDYALQKQGSGFAADLGFTYTIGEEVSAYDWKIGFSLLDIGGIRFRNAAQHRVQTVDVRSVRNADYTGIQDADDLNDKIRLFSAQTLSDSAASFQGAAFTMSLPTAFSLQLDRTISDKFSVNATYVQGIPLTTGRVQRGALLALTPQFGNRWFGAAVPVSLYNWQRLQLGLSLRIAFLTIGSDKIGSIFSRRDFSGTDVYFAIKVNPFKLRGDDSSYGRRGGKRMRAGNSKVKCYDW